MQTIYWMLFSFEIQKLSIFVFDLRRFPFHFVSSIHVIYHFFVFICDYSSLDVLIIVAIDSLIGLRVWQISALGIGFKAI